MSLMDIFSAAMVSRGGGVVVPSRKSICIATKVQEEHIQLHPLPKGRGGG